MSLRNFYRRVFAETVGPRCVFCGAGPSRQNGILRATRDGLAHWLCIPTYLRRDAEAARHYFVGGGSQPATAGRKEDDELPQRVNSAGLRQRKHR